MGVGDELGWVLVAVGGVVGVGEEQWWVLPRLTPAPLTPPDLSSPLFNPPHPSSSLLTPPLTSPPLTPPHPPLTRPLPAAGITNAFRDREAKQLQDELLAELEADTERSARKREKRRAKKEKVKQRKQEGMQARGGGTGVDRP